MNTKKNAVLAVLAVIASMGCFGGQVRFSKEKVQIHTALPVG